MYFNKIMKEMHLLGVKKFEKFIEKQKKVSCR